MLSDRQKIRRAERNGILMPRRLLKAVKWARIPYWAACAFTMQETSGGQNVFGHDGGRGYPFYGHGEVTQCNYSVYKIEADRTGNRQGVGPLQLTSKGYQDRADELGGCWQPIHNMQAAFEAMRGWRTQGKSWHDIARLYNGSESYADEMDDRFAFWREAMDADERGLSDG